MARSSKKTPLIGYGLPLQEPKLFDVLLSWKTQLLIGLNCVKVGQVVKFYPTTRTADVQIQFQRVMKDGTVKPYPKLTNRPVFTLQGGGAALQFPVAAGDQCIVLFSDRNLDNWYLNGNQQPPVDGRLHDLSDGVVLVGLDAATSAFPAPSATEARLILKDGVTKVGLANGKITVQNATQNLATVLNVMLGAMAAATTVAQVAAAAATAQTALATLLY